MATKTKVILVTIVILLSLTAAWLYSYFKILIEKYNKENSAEIEKKARFIIILLVVVLLLMVGSTLSAILFLK